MGFSNQFDTFDPVGGYVPGWPFRSLPDIAKRVRKLLANNGRTREQIVAGARIADFFIEQWYMSAQEAEIERLRDTIADIKKYDPNADDLEYIDAQRFFVQEADATSGGSLLFNKEMEYDLADRVSERTSEVEALQAGVSGWILDDETQREFPNGGQHEYLAILALWLVADAISGICEGNAAKASGEDDSGIVYLRAADHAIKAMGALCHAESWLDWRLLKAAFECRSKLDKDRAAIALEQAANATRKVMASNAAIARHHENRLLKAHVIAYYEEHESEFPSVEAAAAAIAGKIVLLKHRTVANQISSYRKERSTRRP